MAYIEVDGLRFALDRCGQGPPVVLLHGFTGARATWHALAAALEAEFTVIAPDLIGHGETESPRALERYGMRRAVEDLAALLRAQGFERAAWLGYSLGGRVALQVAVHRPDVVSALVLEGASPGLATAEEREERMRADEVLADRIERDGLEWFVEHWGSLPLWHSQRETLSEAERAALREQRLRNDPVGLANSLRGMGTGAQEALHDRLGEIGVPVLLSAGTLDTKFSAIAREMAAAIPDARVQLIEGAGHAAHLERPEAFNGLVCDFLRRVQGAR